MPYLVLGHLVKNVFSKVVIPWCTYTDPEIAHVGLYPQEAEKQGIAIDSYTTEFKDVDRSIVSGHTEGFVKIHVKKGSDQIVGATIVGHNAGDMISELTLAIVNKVGLGKISGVVHPYPTEAEAIRKTADAYSRTRLTPLVQKLFRRWLAFMR